MFTMGKKSICYLPEFHYCDERNTAFTEDRAAGKLPAQLVNILDKGGKWAYLILHAPLPDGSLVDRANWEALKEEVKYFVQIGDACWHGDTLYFKLDNDYIGVELTLEQLYSGLKEAPVLSDGILEQLTWADTTENYTSALVHIQEKVDGFKFNMDDLSDEDTDRLVQECYDYLLHNGDSDDTNMDGDTAPDPNWLHVLEAVKALGYIGKWKATIRADQPEEIAAEASFVDRDDAIAWALEVVGIKFREAHQGETDPDYHVWSDMFTDAGKLNLDSVHYLRRMIRKDFGLTFYGEELPYPVYGLEAKVELVFPKRIAPEAAATCTSDNDYWWAHDEQIVDRQWLHCDHPWRNIYWYPLGNPKGHRTTRPLPPPDWETGRGQ